MNNNNKKNKNKTKKFLGRSNTILNKMNKLLKIKI